MTIDPIALTADLIRCPSVTPVEGGALQLLDRLLSDAGFETYRVDRGDTPNLYARWGARAGRPNRLASTATRTLCPSVTKPLGRRLRLGQRLLTA